MQIDIFFVGPLPPPVNGFANMNYLVLNFLRIHFSVKSFDLAPRSKVITLLPLFFFIKEVISSKPKILYIPLSGGQRQWIDLLFILIAKIFNIAIIIHHHSFSYIEKRKTSFYIISSFCKGSTHITLCNLMKYKLSLSYLIPIDNIEVISNSSFIKFENIKIHSCKLYKDKSKFLTIGFLSNITKSKGIFEFISVMRESLRLGYNIEALIAGPLDDSIRDQFFSEIGNIKTIKYIGAVYGDEKKFFFSNIDILFFPTLYINEAEPVTIIESFGHHIPVIAFSRGCISEMLSIDSGFSLDYSVNYINDVLEIFQKLINNPTLLTKLKNGAFESFINRKLIGEISLKMFIENIHKIIKN